jgi:hypothetical protein
MALPPQKTSCKSFGLAVVCITVIDSGACTFFRGVPHPHLLGVQLLNLFLIKTMLAFDLTFTYKEQRISEGAEILNP